MKTSAIVRIVVWSIVAVLLCGILVSGLIGGNIFGINLSFGSSFSYPNSERYIAGGASISTANIEEIKVNWVSGKVVLIETDEKEISFSENSAREISDKDKMRYDISNGKLTIQFSAPRSIFNFFTRNPDKTLELKVPKGIMSSLRLVDISSVSASIENDGVYGKNTKLNTVSGRIYADSLNCEDLELETVSGSIEATNCKADTLDSSSVSGGIQLEGDFKDLRTDNVSGKATTTLSSCPDRLKMHSVSGSVGVTIPENTGFTAKYSSVSGGFECDFAANISKKEAVYKDGDAKFDFDTVSGNIRIEKK